MRFRVGDICMWSPTPGYGEQVKILEAPRWLGFVRMERIEDRRRRTLWVFARELTLVVAHAPRPPPPVPKVWYRRRRVKVKRGR